MASAKKPAKIARSVVNTLMGVKSVDRPFDSPLSADAAPRSSAPDWRAIATYLGGTGLQILIMVGVLWGLEQLSPLISERWQIAPALAFFILVSIRSRLFSPLDNTRSSRTYDSIRRPGWAPPPLAFPLVWMTMGVLRVISSYLVWQASDQSYLVLPFVLFMVHLALGDTWNTIFTVQSRLGAALPVVILGPLASAIVVTTAYGSAIATAGYLLIPLCAWLTIASLLVFDIWRLNGKEPLYPIREARA